MRTVRGPRPCRGGARFERTARARPVGVLTATGRIVVRELHGRQPGAEEVGLDADDGACTSEAIVRDGVHPERARRRAAEREGRHRVVGHVSEAVPGTPLHKETAGRRTDERARQQGDPLARRGGLREPRLDARVQLFPRRRLSLPHRALQSRTVIERQHRRLPHRAGAAAEQRRLAVAFDLDRPAVPRLDQEAAGRAAAAACRRVPVRDAGRHFLRLVQERDGLLHAAAGAPADRGGGDAESGERQEVAARRRGWRPGPRALPREAVTRDRFHVAIAAKLLDALPESQFGTHR